MKGPRVAVVAPPGAVRARVALLHSNGMGAAFYRPLAERLARRGIRVALLDLPGFVGVPAAEPAGWDGLLDAVAPVLVEQLGADGVLVGHSLGGLVAVLLGGRVPVRGRVLMEPAVIPWRWLTRLAARRYVDQVFDSGPPTFSNRGPWFWRLHDPGSYPSERIELVMQTHGRTDRRAVAALQRTLPERYPLPFDALVGHTLVVRGASSGPVMRLGQRDLIRRLPDASGFTLPKAGHWMVGEQDELLLDLLTRAAI